jgi:hypothetical protein
VPIRVAYKFRTLRKVLYDQWDLINFKASKAHEIGDETAPINIEHLGVDLADLDTIIALMSHKEHQNVGNLTQDQVT